MMWRYLTYTISPIQFNQSASGIRTPLIVMWTESNVLHFQINILKEMYTVAFVVHVNLRWFFRDTKHPPVIENLEVKFTVQSVICNVVYKDHSFFCSCRLSGSVWKRKLRKRWPSSWAALSCAGFLFSPCTWSGRSVHCAFTRQSSPSFFGSAIATQL